MLEVILLEKVGGLGVPGDQVRVKPGFALNFLLPQGKAERVNPDVLRRLPALKEKAEREESVLVASMEELAQKLDGTAVKIEARSTEEGHLFGSVTEKEITAALVSEGWDGLPDRAIRLEEHIKEAGDFEALAHLYGEIEAAIKVTVVPVDAEGNIIEVVEVEERELSEAEMEVAEAIAESEAKPTPEDFAAGDEEDEGSSESEEDSPEEDDAEEEDEGVDLAPEDSVEEV